MDTRKDSCGARAGPVQVGSCAACGGSLAVLVEIPPQAEPYARGHPSTQYLRCVGCGQIQIVDDRGILAEPPAGP